jgi:hypothetical protein
MTGPLLLADAIGEVMCLILFFVMIGKEIVNTAVCDS